MDGGRASEQVGGEVGEAVAGMHAVIDSLLAADLDAVTFTPDGTITTIRCRT